MIHRLVKQLAEQLLASALPLAVFRVRETAGVPYFVLKFGSGAPDGTPNAAVYINIAADATTATRIYVDNDGTWAAQTT